MGAVRDCAINAQADLGHRPRHHSASPGWIDPAAPATVDPGARSSCAPAFYWQESFLQWWETPGTHPEPGRVVMVLRLKEQNHSVGSVWKQMAWDSSGRNKGGFLVWLTFGIVIFPHNDLIWCGREWGWHRGFWRRRNLLTFIFIIWPLIEKETKIITKFQWSNSFGRHKILQSAGRTDYAASKQLSCFGHLWHSGSSGPWFRNSAAPEEEANIPQLPHYSSLACRGLQLTTLLFPVTRNSLQWAEPKMSHLSVLLTLDTKKAWKT